MSLLSSPTKAAGSKLGWSGREDLRRRNLAVILRELHLSGSRTRSELGTHSGLNRSTVADLVRRLEAAGVVREGPPPETGLPGRPSPLVEVIPGAAYVVSLEIQIDSIAAALIGLGGIVHRRLRVDRSREELSPDRTVRELVRLVRRVTRGQDVSRVVGVAVAVAGVVDRQRGRVVLGPSLAWQDVPITEMLVSALEVRVPVTIANEADCGVLGEITRGAGSGTTDLIFISGGVGVGGGLVIGGRLLSGSRGVAGEIGHMKVNPGGKRCRCGATGCWQTEVGEEALLASARIPPDAGRPGVARALAAARAGDPDARRAVEAVATWLGLGIANLVHAFNPQRVILGGFFADAFPLFDEALQAAVVRNTLATSLEGLSIVPSALGPDTGLVGAAELVFDDVVGRSLPLLAAAGPAADGDQRRAAVPGASLALGAE